MFKRIMARIKKVIIYLITLQFIVDIYKKLKKLTVIKLIKILILSALSLSILATVALFALVHYPATQIPEYEPVDQTVYLDQGWGTSGQSAQRQQYYYTAQGTNLKGLEYEWFTQLEMPWGQEKFANPNHMKAYGFIVDDKPSPKNTHRLPIGFTQHYSELDNANLLDITCSACHNGQLNITKNGKRTAVRIDGGQAMHAFTTMSIGHFVPTMVASLASTYFNPFKFDRFAKNVLQINYNEQTKAVLKERFSKVLWRFVKQGYNDSSKHLYPVEEGFGRTDALARIGNTVFGDNLAEENYHVATGPVSYPPVWNIWKFDWVQYGASVKQPMARNMGEALGVGAHITFTDSYGQPLSPEERFNSSVLAENIYAIENNLQSLTPPQWPAQLFGDIDHEKAAKGKVLFKQHCQGCHGPFVASDLLKQVDMPLKGPKDPLWILKTLTIEEIGTDPNTAFNFVNNRFNLSKTGLSDNDISNTVRPIHIKQLQRLAKSVLMSDRLATFLSTQDPRAEQLTFTTNWVQLHQDEFNQLATIFRNWQSSYTNLYSLHDTIATYGDVDVQTDIKTALIKQQLQLLDSTIESLDIEKLTVGEALNLIGIIIREKHYQDKNYTPEQQACYDGFAALDTPQQPLAYKARPLEGIWATPPFLHNGSVPNIYQLLSPVTERDSTFFVGRREYDPVNLGYVTTSLSKSGFWFDTSISGNTNIGHEFRAGYVPYKPGNPPQYGVIGPELTTAERWQLVEYLKIHKDEKAQTTYNSNINDNQKQSNNCNVLLGKTYE
jgi:hypothetical protein